MYQHLESGSGILKLIMLWSGLGFPQSHTGSHCNHPVSPKFCSTVQVMWWPHILHLILAKRPRSDVVASHKLTVLESPLLTYWSCNYRLCIFGAQDHWKPNNHNEQLILHVTASFSVHTPFGWPHCNNYNTSILLLEYKYCQFSSVVQ